MTSGGAAVAFSDAGATVTYKVWTGAYTNPNGSIIGETANIWLAYLIVFTAVDTTVANPTAFFADGYVVKYTYLQRANDVDDAVEFRYKIGIKIFDEPMADKIMKKILTRHEGTAGSMTVKWENENGSGEFNIDLTAFPKTWDSFFPSTAYGKEIDIEIYKNDNYDFKFKELKLVYTPEPVLI